MLSISNIEDFTSKIGLSDSQFSVVKRDSFGDFIEAYDSETEYNDVRKAILNNRSVRNNIIDSGISYYEVADTVYVDGNKTYISILCETGSTGIGTTIKMMVKRVEYAINGEMKSFLSFESLKNYLNRITK